MDSFLDGFADELVKLGAAAPLAATPSRPKQAPGQIKMLKQTAPARGTSPPPARPANAHSATSKALRATPPQAIKTWGTKKDDWHRPSPRHVPTAKPKKPEVKVKVKKKRRGKKSVSAPSTKDRRLAGESKVQFALRRVKERSDWNKEQNRQGRYTAHSRDTKAEKAFKKDPVQQAHVKNIPSVRRGGTIQPREAPVHKSKAARLVYEKQQAWNRQEIANRIRDASTVKGPSDQLPKSSPTTQKLKKHKHLEKLEARPAAGSQRSGGGRMY